MLKPIMLINSKKNRLSIQIFKNVYLALGISLLFMGCQPNSNDTDHSNTKADSAVTTETVSQTTNQSATTQATEQPSTISTESIIEQPITILALGDSLTEGLGVAEDKAYPAQLETALKQAGYVNAKVVNSGLSGETSSGLVNRLDWVLKTHPDITILTTGANDAMRGIDVDVIEKNLRTAIEQLQSEGSIVVLGGMQVYDNLGDDYVQSFSNIYPRLAEEYDIAFIPFFLEGVGGVSELNQSDAIHPTAEGYTKIVNNNILPVLTPTINRFIEQQPEPAPSNTQ